MLRDMASLLPKIARKSELRCMLVDDNEAILQAIASLLRSEGIEVIGQGRTGLEALRLLDSLPPTAIVLDVNLPDLDGLEVARRAAEIARKRTPVIFYTSYADQAFVVDALDAGARAVVLKDAPPINLLDAIAEVSTGGVYIDPRLRVASVLNRR
jgi:DNA-binding NarL/FixJ family response regulator